MKRIVGTTFSFALAIALTASLGSFGSAAVLSIDIGDGGGGFVQSGFDEFLLSTNPDTFGAVTVQMAGVGASGITDRLRGGGADPPASGTFNQTALMTDFVFNDNSNEPTEGIDVTVSGLGLNTDYNVWLWAYDSATDNPNGNPNRAANWTANGTSVITNKSSVGPPPTSNSDYRHYFVATSDAAGTILLAGREAGSQTGVLINGLRITEIPEPTSLMLLGLGLLGLAGSARRQRS